MVPVALTTGRMRAPIFSTIFWSVRSAYSVVFWELRVVAAQNVVSDVSDDSAQCLCHEWAGVGGLQVEHLLCVQEIFNGGQLP